MLKRFREGTERPSPVQQEIHHMLTKNERTALEAIRRSEYQSGNRRDDVVGHSVWTQYCNPFENKRTQSGVYASLSKKGFIRISDYDGMGTVAITEEGWDAAMISTARRDFNRRMTDRRTA